MNESVQFNRTGELSPRTIFSQHVTVVMDAIQVKVGVFVMPKT